MNLKEIVLKSNLYGTCDASICARGPGYVNCSRYHLTTLYAVFMPVRNVNHSIHSYGNGNDKQEILFLEIWTNGSLTPKEALHEASRNLIDLFIPFLHKEEENLPLEDNQHTIPLSAFPFHNKLDKLRKNKKNSIEIHFS
ncbi:hypothetical protein ACJIZ3_000420 [Penstemon smallii]|uniref:DNA-directed RNA polymerase RpoA/D/Rpb3-type domain-containing protein n=1 Tax=Penstemon smallii TaxID=265156 RepID=A0ABD3RJ21_9LAMI